MAGAHGGENPRAKPAPRRRRRPGEPADPPGVDLELLPRLAIDDRDRRGGLAKLQLEHCEAIQRRIRDPDALPREQFPNLRQPEPVGQPAANRIALRLTLGFRARQN